MRAQTDRFPTLRPLLVASLTWSATLLVAIAAAYLVEALSAHGPLATAEPAAGVSFALMGRH
jgi:hypothetical protein